MDDKRALESEVRQDIIDHLRIDLIGPSEDEEVLETSPRFEYLTGMLYSQRLSDAQNEEMLANLEIPHVGDTEEETQDLNARLMDKTDEIQEYEMDSEEEHAAREIAKYQQQSSIGMSFYLKKSARNLTVHVSWGDYDRVQEEYTDSNGKQRKKNTYHRRPMSDDICIDMTNIDKTCTIPLVVDSNIKLTIIKYNLTNDYMLVTLTLSNHRPDEQVKEMSIIFQAYMEATTDEYFIAENICRNKHDKEDIFYNKRPIFGRGRGCAVKWTMRDERTATKIATSFIPEYELPGVDASVEGFDEDHFNVAFMSRSKHKEDIIARLTALKDAYDQWINEELVNSDMMTIGSFKERYGDDIVSKCRHASERIAKGIRLLSDNNIAFKAFCFMNSAMCMQKAISSYANEHGKGIPSNFQNCIATATKDFRWRPFQIAFILMNLESIVNPLSKDRDVVDLLYFPTGGGKTEAYLGLMAFTIANRRLRSKQEDKYNRDGGVTIILRYTLRLLTTQQRDRLLKMVIAAEMIREKNPQYYGTEPISLGFWVGGGVTPNSFDFLSKKDTDFDEYSSNMRLIRKQVLTCPFCGAPLTDDRCFEEDPEGKQINIYCMDEHCIFNKYKTHMPIPLYLVDEQIYSKCPTILLSTVDKFASLPWKAETKALFGKVDRKCSRDGYVVEGVKHPVHNATDNYPKSELVDIKPFAPPELIVQDELHLITGPLGTIYGAYETMIENLSTYEHDGKKILPKYVVSTATIKNADEQVRSLYARKQTEQFPPNGIEIGDSFFVREVPIEKNPFRKYVGISVAGKSVKTTLLRVYAVLLERVHELETNEKYKGVLDPYYTLVGYFNSIRELGGTVRLLQDDIPKRIWRLKKKYKLPDCRFINKYKEITSRISSSEITRSLNDLEQPMSDKKNCLDAALATNMIAVGMDVDRLGMMCVMGQPKQNSEYIQATSRIGRRHPGLVVTVYNPYRPRDLSHYENFAGYHEQFYRYVEGTTATPFSARARDRALHALIISAIRLTIPRMASNDKACDILDLTQNEEQKIIEIILDRLAIVNPKARIDTKEEIEIFISEWKQMAGKNPPLVYALANKNANKRRLMAYYGDREDAGEKQTLTSMREVESASTLYYKEI